MVNIFICFLLQLVEVLNSSKEGEIDSTVPFLLSFCHPEVHLVNVPSESIGLRDGGALGVAG